MKICLEFLSFFTTGEKYRAGFFVFGDIKFPQKRCFWMTCCQDPSVNVEVQILGERTTRLRYTYVAYVFTASRHNISKLQFYMHVCRIL